MRTAPTAPTRGRSATTARAFGHDGAGGSCGLADPDASIALGYVTNRTGSRPADDPRKTALVNAVYAAHGETTGR